MIGIEVVSRGRDAYVLLVDGLEQSYVDLCDPTLLRFDYVQRLGDVLDVAFPPGERIRVAHVGGAAMTLPRYVAATRPTSAQVVFEPAAEVVAVVEEHLPLPRRCGVRVRVTDGRSGLATLPDARLDAVVVDAFSAGRVPGDLATLEWFADVARVLAPHGLLAMNVVDRPPLRWTRRLVAAVDRHLPHQVVLADPSTWRARRGGNLVVLASRVPLPAEELVLAAERAGHPVRMLDGQRVRESLGGGTAFTDADAEPSPAP